MYRITILPTLLLAILLFHATVPPAAAQHYRLWGTTYDGGQYGIGTLFRFTPQRDSLEVLSNFYTTVLGGPKRPNSGVIWDSVSGKLFGTATDGGLRPGLSNGAIFSFRPSDSSFKTEYDCYISSAGRIPLALPTAAGSTTLWGTDFMGGSASYGTLYEFDIASGAKTVHKNFSTTDAMGTQAYQGPVFAQNGKLYGLTRGVGSGVGGVLYCFDTTSKIYTVKHTFASATSREPMSRLLAASNGRLYGTTTSGGPNGAGSLFEFDPSTDSIHFRQPFSFIATGSQVVGALLEYAGGIWGVAASGGAGRKGTIFRYDTATRALVNKFDLVDSIGASPMGGLCLAPDGLMYATANTGGRDGLGTIFSYDPVSNTARRRVSFNDTNGSHPYYSILTPAWTNDRPRMRFLTVTDTLCEGDRGSVTLSAADADRDTLSLIPVISDTSIIGGGSLQLSYLGAGSYQLAYAADSPHRDTGWVTVTAHLSDPYGGVTEDSVVLRLYFKSCAVVNVSTGVPAVSRGTVNLTPNPAGGVVRVTVPGSGRIISRCEIQDLSGRTYPRSLTGNTGTAATLFVEDLVPGIYLVRIAFSDGTREHVRLIRR